MENAKRIVLVDEEMLEYQSMLQHFHTKQNLSWKRPTEQSVKSALSKAMKLALGTRVRQSQAAQAILESISADETELVEEPPVGDIKADVKGGLIYFGPTVDELLDIKADTKKKSRKSKRAKNKPERYADIKWGRW